MLSKPLCQKTIWNILSSKDQIYSVFQADNLEVKSNKKFKIPQLNNDIANYIETINSRGIFLNRASVIVFAIVIANRKLKMHELPEKD